MSQNCLPHTLKTKTRLKLSAALSRNVMWIIIADFLFFIFSPVFKEAGNGCDGSINQLGGNVLESHRRFWHCSKTGTVSDPAAMASPSPPWKHILSYINPISLFINMLRLSISPSFMRHFHFAAHLPNVPALFSSIVLLGNDKTV